MQSKHPDFECGKLHLCTHLNETFYRDGKAVEDASADGIVSPFFDDKKGCAMLEKEEAAKVHFAGDSYMRHIYQAFMITLTGDYEQGSVPHHIKQHAKYSKSNCAYHRQFSVKELFG